MNDWTVLAAMAALGGAAQAWRAQAALPNWAVYPILLACALLVQLTWGDDTLPKMFFRHALESFLVALGANRITSDSARGTILETKEKAA